jgi:SHS2 domain-containing protein
VGRIELFDHTADLGMRVVASDLDDLFRTAAEGLFDVIVADRSHVQPLERESVELAAESAAALLVSWLNELIYRSETGHRFYSKFDVRVAPDGRSLAAEVLGEPVDFERHVVDHEVKAVTRHGFRLEPQPGGGWLAELILDI